VLVPVTPGRHIRELAVFRPKGTLSQQLAAATLGGAPQYQHPNVILSGDSRFGHAVLSCGLVHVEFNVILKGFGTHIHTFGALHPVHSVSAGVGAVCDGECPPSPSHLDRLNAGHTNSPATHHSAAQALPLTAASIGSNERLLAARAGNAAAANALLKAAVAGLPAPAPAAAPVASSAPGSAAPASAAATSNALPAGRPMVVPATPAVTFAADGTVIQRSQQSMPEQPPASQPQPSQAAPAAAAPSAAAPSSSSSAAAAAAPPAVAPPAAGTTTMPAPRSPLTVTVPPAAPAAGGDTTIKIAS
jgi:hypothetical protein